MCSLIRSVAAALTVGLVPFAPPALVQGTDTKPNILVIMGDDVGYWNTAAYNHCMMGCRTPQHQPDR